MITDYDDDAGDVTPCALCRIEDAAVTRLRVVRGEARPVCRVCADALDAIWAAESDRLSAYSTALDAFFLQLERRKEVGR